MTTYTLEKDFIGRAVTGNKEAFEHLFVLYIPEIRGYFARRVGANDADDFVSIVYLKAQEAIGRYEDKGNPFGAWLFAIAKNIYNSHLREIGRRREVSLTGNELPLFSQADDFGKLDAAYLIEFYNQNKHLLSPTERGVMDLHNDSVPYKNIAAKLNITKNSAKVHAWRARSKMRLIRDGYEPLMHILSENENSKYHRDGKYYNIVLNRLRSAGSIKCPDISTDGGGAWTRREDVETILEELQQSFLSYLKEHPEATTEDVKGAGFGYDLWIAYRGRINDARRDAGIGIRNVKQFLSLKERKQRVRSYLQGYPEANTEDVKGAGFGYDLWIAYRGRINDARRDAGIGIRNVKQFLSLEERKQRVLSYLKEHPEATKEDAIGAGYGSDLQIAYRGRINDARRDAGVELIGLLLY